MALRTHEGNEAQVCFFIIQLLLLKPQDFRNRVCELVKSMSPEHYHSGDFHGKHMDFHNKFPEKFMFDEMPGSMDSNSASSVQTLPTYFGNVCLRFIPVFDIVVHRYTFKTSILFSLVY
jgi:mediator of RNA polymerase II transcription subunit 23